jgi:anti-sigma factor RsiW
MSSEHLSTEMLLRHLDRELDAAEQSRVVDHLAACPECRAVFARFRVVSGAVDDYAADLLAPARSGQRRELIAALDCPVVERPRKAYAVLAMAASVLLAVSLSIYPYRSQHPPAALHPPAGDNFIALPYSNENLSSDGAVVMQVEVPRSAVAFAGGPVGDGPVKVEVVVGVDGLARAIRFVN